MNTERLNPLRAWLEAKLREVLRRTGRSLSVVIHLKQRWREVEPARVAPRLELLIERALGQGGKLLFATIGDLLTLNVWTRRAPFSPHVEIRPAQLAPVAHVALSRHRARGGS